MPKGKPKEKLIDWKARDANRLLRAIQRQVPDRPLSVLKQPDGTLTIKVAPASDPDRESDDPNEWDR